MTNLWGKIVVITGASEGIGKAIASALVEVGSKVVGCARNLDTLSAVASELNAKGPGEMLALKCDVSIEEDVLDLFKVVDEKYQSLYGIINNAAYGKAKPLLSGNAKQEVQMLNVNVMGVAMMNREGVKMMKKYGVDDGHIININSILGHMVVANMPYVHFYAATKHALNALSQGLRQELRNENSHIRVTQISPGLVKTSSLEKSGISREIVEQIFSTKQVLEASDVADAVLYALQAPARVNVSEIMMLSNEESY